MLYSIVTSLSLLLSASVAHAGVMVSSACFATVYASPDPSDYPNRYCRSGSDVTPLPLSGGYSDLTIQVLDNPSGDVYYPVARADYAARGDNGNLGVRVDTWAAVPSTYPGRLNATAWAWIGLTNNDKVTVTSATLQAGTLVNINLSGYMEGLVNHTVFNVGESAARMGSVAELAFNVGVFDQGSGRGFGWGNTYISGSNNLGNTWGADRSFFDAYSEMVEVAVGSTLLISSSLFASSSSGFEYGGAGAGVSARGQVDAMNTFSTYLTPVTEGVQLLAESGYDYSDYRGLPTAVSEPGTLVLLGLGCFLLMCIQKTTSQNRNQLRRTGS